MYTDFAVAAFLVGFVYGYSVHYLEEDIETTFKNYNEEILLLKQRVKDYNWNLYMCPKSD